jgi:hypothetical protein
MNYLRLFCCTLLLSLLATSLRAVTLDEARAYINNEQYPEAVHAFRSLMNDKSIAQRADCNKWFGQALCMTGAYDEAVPYLEYAAKRQVKGAYWYLALCRQQQYNFEGAIASAKQYRTAMKSSAYWVDRSDSLIAKCEADLKAVSRVRDVVIIDSLTVPREQFFLQYRPGAESGRLLAASDCGTTFADAADGMVFETQAGTLRIFVSASDPTQLYESHLSNGAWDEPRPLEGLETGGRRIAYPFVRTDGETFYFALEDADDGLGGYDLYETHYDTESESFYTPERLPMPFNSPGDDYMMAIDETHQVGWWATSRHASPEFLTIYLFQVEDEPSYLSGDQISAARIDALSNTWRTPEGYADLVAQVMEAPQEAVATGTEFIVINDNRVYTSEGDFRSSDARRAYEQAQATQSQLTELQEQLDAARQEWHDAASARRTQLRPTLLKMEEQELQLRKQLAQQQLKYRNLESMVQ